MRNLNKSRHFLSHTFEHLAVVFVLLLVAVTMSIVGKVVENRHSLLSLAVASYPVAFSVENVDTQCIEGITKSKYNFNISPVYAGSVALVTPGGMDYIDTSKNALGTSRILSVGTYAWSGSPKSGYVGSNSGNIVVNEICPTVQTTASSSNVVIATNSEIPVVFKVSTTATVSCINDKPFTKVVFTVSENNGGEFLLSSNSWTDATRYTPGTYSLPNGYYEWKGTVRQGYTSNGQITGVFDVQNSCPSSSVNTTINTPSTILNGVDSLGEKPEARLFIENKPISDISKIYDKEQIEVRISTGVPSAIVKITTINSVGESRTLGNAVRDDLLSREGKEVWSYVWDMSKAPSGSYRLMARVTYSNAKVVDTDKVLLTIRHTERTNTASPEMSQKTPIAGYASPEERRAIASRISDPSSCGNTEECKIYCKNVNDEGNFCQEFAQKVFSLGLATNGSLADNVSEERLLQMLRDPKRRSKEIPEIVQSPQMFREFCSNSAHFDTCTTILNRNDMSAPTSLAEQKKIILDEKSKERELFTLRIGTRAYLDTDNDGVTDFDEVNIYRTNPNKGDTDNDGFQDGAELLARTNPRGGMDVGTTTTASVEISEESVVFENPKLAGEIIPTLLAIKSIEVVEIMQKDDSTTTAKKLKFGGIAPPNAFVTLYIFSDPIVVTVKADAMGSWTYTFDKELHDGTHEVYSAITNTDGHIVAKSEGLPFVKTATAVSLGGQALLPGGAQSGFFSGTSLLAFLAMIIGVFGIALSVVGFVVRRENKEDPPQISKS